MVMPRFGAGDAIYILPQYAHLHPANTAEVIRVVPDTYHPMFNEYVVEFADGSQATVMEFQIIEDVPGYNTDIARLVLSSQHQPLTAHVRGVTAIGQIILRTPGYDIDMTIQVTKLHTSIMGQVLERATTNLLKDLEVRLMKDSKLITTTGSDSVGIFKFRDVPSGPLNIVVVIPQTTRRIFGAFSI